MITPPLVPLLEAITQVWTQYIFVLLFETTTRHTLAVVFALDLLIIILTITVRHFFERHCLVYPMLRALDLAPPYSAGKTQRLLEVFERGLEADED